MISEAVNRSRRQSVAPPRVSNWRAIGRGKQGPVEQAAHGAFRDWPERNARAVAVPKLAGGTTRRGYLHES